MRVKALLGLVLPALLAVAGCGGGDGGADASARPTKTRTLRLGEFSWTAATVTNTILEQIVARNPQLGIERVERVRMGPEEAWSELAEGDLDVLTEVYIPNQERFVREANEEAELVHRTYAGAVNAWYVPRYAVEKGGPAAGLRSIDQLNRYARVFDAKLFDGDPGWVTTEQNADRIEGFGLDLEHETGSEARLVRELQRRYKARKPILLYLWRPHWVHSAFDLVELEEPNAYSGDCFTGSKQACAMPTNDVWIAARKDLEQRAPRVWRLLTQFEIPIGDIEAMLVEVDEKKRPAAVVAREWIARNGALIGRWLQG